MTVFGLGEFTPTVLLRTPHGSSLYGFDHWRSDKDWYTVVTKRPGQDPFTTKTRHSTQAFDFHGDSVVKDFGTWLMECQNGVPQALEAMFSREATTDLLPDLRGAYRASTGVWAYYRRTMTNFAVHPGFKRRRHAVRLALNMRDMRATGRFDPRLSFSDSETAYWAARHLRGEELVEHVLWLAFGT